MKIHMKFFQDILGNRRVISLSKCLLFPVLSYYLIINFMKFIYDHSVMMHVKLHEDDIGCGEVIAL